MFPPGSRDGGRNPETSGSRSGSPGLPDLLLHLEYPPVRLFWFSGDAFTEGVQIHKVGGVPLRIYGPEKTVADCFKHRNKIGLEVALEALKTYRRRKSFNVDKLLHCARVCRVEKIMRPYLEALL